MGTYKRLPEPVTRKQLRWLAEHLVGMRVVTADDVPPRLIATVFLPLGFGGLKGYTRKQLTRLVVFGVIGVDKTADRSINGFPMFFEMRLWRRTDFIEAQKIAVKAFAAMNDGEEGDG